MPLTALQPKRGEVVNCGRCDGSECYLISVDPLRIWRCRKCKRVLCPIVWRTNTASDDQKAPVGSERF